MIDMQRERARQVLDAASLGRLDRRRFIALSMAVGLVGIVGKEAVAQAAAAGAKQSSNRASLAKAYDYVIVGAGPAGCVLARRLVDHGATVLLIEAGGTDQQSSITEPSVWFTNIGGANDWGRTTVAQPQLDNRELLIGTGKVLGGGSSINGCVWSRGSPHDFDTWAYEGCHGWSFAEVLPVYRHIENWEGGASEWRGAGGPISIRRPAHPHPAAVAWVTAAKQMGLPINEDVNGQRLDGAGLCNLTVNADGTRSSAVRGYLNPVLNRRQLTVLLNTLVTRLTFEGRRCTGVQIADGTATREVRAIQEVIVTAGGIGSPHLLLRSGIGPAADLKRLGLDVVTDLPGVGQNFQDHPLLQGVVLEYRGDMPKPPLGSNAAEATLFHRSRADLPGPDLQPVLMELPVITPAIRKKYGNVPQNAFTLAPGLVRPASRGSVTLAGADPNAAPIVDAAFLREEEDVRAAMLATELCRELGRQKAFDDIRLREVMPGKPLDREELRDFVRRSATSYFHPAGTCRMGTSHLCVVDPELRVRGVEGLRVCDSSVMPTISTGNTCAPTLVIAEKAAALLTAANRSAGARDFAAPAVQTGDIHAIGS